MCLLQLVLDHRPTCCQVTHDFNIKFSLKLCSRLYSIEIEFYSKQKQKHRFLSHPLGDLGSVRTASIARWKARDQLPIHHN